MNAVVGAKKGSNKQRQPVISPDSAQSKTFIKILYGLSEGEIEGLANGLQSIYLEETPLQNADGSLNFENVKVDFRNGTNDQEYIEGFPAVESETAIDVELKSETPWVRAFSNLDLDAVRLRLKWGPLRTQNATNGDVSGVTIEYAIDLQTDGGIWAEVLKTKISDKTSANYERAHRIDLPRADSGWLVRVRRLTPNSTSEYISDKMYIAAVTEVIDAKLRYPNTALLGLQYDAETFGNVAKVAMDTKGRLLKVPTNYNPATRQYVGMWDGTFKEAYSNNPAWIYYDICTVDRYALGDRLTPLMVDKWSLYRLAQYCDQMVPDGLGGQEPRFTCNVYLQSAEGAFEVLTKLAGVFRAITFWAGNSIICDADIPQDTYFTYTRANVIDGNFEYAGTRARDRHNVVKIAWDNPANHYKTEYEFVRDEKAIAEAGQVRILEIDAWGCTSRGQAQRAGWWALKSEQLETRTVSFKVGLDGYIPLPGKVIEIADELFAGRANGGRVSKISADLKSITLDRDDVTAKAGDRLVINGENGKAQTRIVQSISGRVITVTLPFDENSIAVQNVWVLDAKDLATMKFRVISITQDEKHQFGITALQYNPQKFDEIDNGAFFEETPISIVNPSIQDPVKDVLITSESRVDQGINIVTMIVSWTQAKGAVKYLVEWRKDDGSWIRLPQTGNNSVEVPGVYSGQYQARVTAISAFEIASLPASSILTDIKGKQGLPPKLAFIRATGILFGMKLDWGFPPTGAKDTAYTEIEVSPDGATNVAQLGLFAYPTTTNTIQGLQPNLRQFYRGRLIDRIGNVGPWSDWTNGITTADPEAVLDLISGHIAETDLAQELQGKIENTVNVAEAAEQAAANAQTAANSAQTAAGEAKTAASNAQSAATSAQAQASTAQQVANDASVIASNAKNTADNASTAASKVASDLITSTNQLNQKIADESSARIAAISNLNDGLTTETTQRKSEDAALLSNIETYKSSTNGTLSSLQTQITTNATNTSANATQINALDSRLTTNETKTNTAISSAATAQTTANTAVSKADAASTSINTLKSTLRVQADSLNIDPHFVSGLEYYTIAEAPAGNSVTAGAYGENGSLGIRVIKSNADTSGGTNTNVNTNRTDGFFLKANNTYRAIVRCKLISGTGNILGRFHRKSDNAVLASATLSVTSTSAYVDLIYTYKPTSDVLVYFGTWLMAAGTIDYDSISIINATDAVASDANASAITNLTTRVTNAEGTLTSQGNSITQLNNNIVSINGTLASKADATAVSNIDSKVTVIDDKVTSNTSNITSLNNTITNGSLNLVYNTLYNDLSNITANGNHSIAVDSATYARSKVLKVMASGAGQDGVHQILMTATVIPVTSSTEPLVLSFFAKADAALSVKIQLFGGIGAQNIALTTTWTKYTITTLRKSASHVDTTNLYMSLLAAGVAYFTNVQLERGTIATAYSAASTETGNLIAANASALSSLSSTVTQQGNTLTSQGNSITSLNNSLVTTNNNVTTAQNTANNAASAAAAAQNTANTKADASALTALSNTVTTQGNAISSQGSAITSLNNSLNSLAFGSTNLLPGTDLSTHASKDGTFKNGNMISATATTAGSVDMLALKSTVELLAGEYVVSFWAKAETAGTLFNVYFYNPNTTTSGTASNGATTTRADGQVTFSLTTTMTKYFVKYKQSGNTAKKDVLFRIQPPSSGTNKVWLALPQLEEGNVVTDWSPAVTDIATSAALSSLGSTVTQQGNTLTSQGNSITSLNNSVNTINSTLATKADSSAVNSLDSRVSATEGNINSQSNSITSLNNAIKGAIATAGELIPNPTFVPDYNQMGMTVVATTDSEVPTGCAYQYAARLAARDHIPSINNIACKEGDVFEISALVACATGTAGLTLYVGKASTPTASIGSIASGASATVSSTWTRITWKWTVPANCNYFRPYVSVGQSSPFGTVWFITDWHCKNITAAATAQAKADANATALTTLQNTVTQHGGTLTSQGSQITALNNNITSINGALATKADSSALSALDSRVTATENNLTTTNSSITSLQSAIQSQGDALNLDPNFREGLKFITVGELATGNSIVAGNYGEGGGTGLRVTKANDAGTSGTNPTVKTPTSGVWLKAGRTYRATVRARKVSGTTGLLLRWIRASDSATLAPSQVTATDTTNFVDFSLDYTPTSDVLAWFGVWMYPNAGVIDYSSIRLTDRTASVENATTASAVSSLTSRVASAEGTITSQGNSIVSLNNSVSNINGALATKADNAALSSLDSRVTATENSITSQGSQITSLQAGLSAAAVIGTNLLSNTAVPNSANQPKTSDGTTSVQGFSTNFNIDSYFSISDTSVERFYRMTSPVNAASVLRVNTTYTISADVRGAALPVRWRIIAQVGGAWSDIAVKSMSGISNNQYTRQSCTFTVPANATSLIMSFQSDSTTVGNALAVRRLKLEVGSAATLWEQPIGEIATSKALSSLDTRVTNAEGTISSQSNSITQLNNTVSNINGVLASKADASALSSLDSKVSVIDGKVSTQASSITTLQTTVGGNTAAIQQVTESVDGVKAQQYLKMDVNGHLSGHGSMNDGTTSTFIFNYDTIQFGAPVGVDGVTPKPIMSLLNTPLTLPNGTVIPRGLYVDSGSFGYINANRIWAENLSTISADLGDIEVDNAHIKNGAIDTLKIQDEAVTVPSGVINQTERKFYFAVSNSMAGSVGYTQDLVTLNVQTQGGKLRIDGSFVFDCKVRITQYSSSYDILKCVTLACRVLVNGTVAYTQEIYPTFYDGNSTIRFIGVTATPVYILPASTGTKTIVLQLAYITKYSNIYYGSFEAQGGFADTPSIITMSSLSTLELKK